MFGSFDARGVISSSLRVRSEDADNRQKRIMRSRRVLSQPQVRVRARGTWSASGVAGSCKVI